MLDCAGQLMEIVFWLSLFAIAYSYCFYPIVLRMAAGVFGRPPHGSPDSLPPVAIVIPVHNEEKIISEKLRNIFSVDYPADKLSVWIGSDCSTDHTDEMVKSWDDPRVHLWRPETRSGKAGILNRLVPMADAEIVLLTDADIMLDRSSIRALAGDFADTRIGGVGGLTLQKQQGMDVRNEETAYRLYEAKLKTLESRLHSTISAFGSFYAIRKKLFVPFHPHTYSNDDVIMPMNIIRQGYRMYYEPSAVSYEEVVPRLTTEFRRRVRIGAGNFQAFFWLLDFLNPMYGWPWFCYVSHKVSRWFSPMFICASAAACGVLAFGTASLLYKTLFIAGALFTASGLLYKIIPLKFPRKVFYFLAMNAALILGFFRFLGGIRSAAWTRTERQA